MKELQSILFGVALREVVGSTKQLVNDIEIDSRKVTPSSVFVAISGAQMDGHHFIETAIEKGAIVIVCEKLPELTLAGVTYLVVESTSVAVAIMAHQFYNEASNKIKLVGITGTNGKTTVATLLFKLFKGL